MNSSEVVSLQHPEGLLFEKWHGAQNDFLFVEALKLAHLSVPQLRVLAQHICHRRTGIGADGLVLWDIPTAENQNFTLLIVNSDGSFAGTCGNALRCFGALLLNHTLWSGLESLAIERYCLNAAELQKDEQICAVSEVFAHLIAWQKPTSLQNNFEIEVEMGKVRQLVPLAKILYENNSIEACFVELANPHLVLYSDIFEQFKTDDFVKCGEFFQSIQREKFLPNMPLSNIGMLSLSQKLTVFERGAGLTACCGSGAVAARVALEHFLSNNIAAQSDFFMPGGTLTIIKTNSHSNHSNANHNICNIKYNLKGPATKIAVGQY